MLQVFQLQGWRFRRVTSRVLGGFHALTGSGKQDRGYPYTTQPEVSNECRTLNKFRASTCNSTGATVSGLPLHPSSKSDAGMPGTSQIQPSMMPSSVHPWFQMEILKSWNCCREQHSRYEIVLKYALKRYGRKPCKTANWTRSQPVKAWEPFPKYPGYAKSSA